MLLSFVTPLSHSAELSHLPVALSPYPGHALWRYHARIHDIDPDFYASVVIVHAYVRWWCDAHSRPPYAASTGFPCWPYDLSLSYAHCVLDRCRVVGQQLLEELGVNRCGSRAGVSSFKCMASIRLLLFISHQNGTHFIAPCQTLEGAKKIRCSSIY